MIYLGLIPFVVLLASFIGFRFPLTYSSFLALLTGTLITQTSFDHSSLVWSTALEKTFEVMVEIGGILIGAFFFLETAREYGVLKSLAKMVDEVSSNRVVQALLVVFPIELMIEGSSGFGTPLLITAPILMELGFSVELCALLPFLTCVFGVPFGALGTPIRLSFGTAQISQGTMAALAPLVFLAPQIAQCLVAKKLKWKESLWVLSLSCFYFPIAYIAAQFGPEFVTLLPAFLTFVFGLYTARVIFTKTHSLKFKNIKGIVVYAALLASMTLGKFIFMDRLIPGTHIRMFNPGLIFIIFGLILHSLSKKKTIIDLFQNTFVRARRTLVVFFCITLLVQELRQNGALISLASGIPEFLKTSGIPLLGWMGAAMVGTSTLSNLLLSPLVDSSQFAILASGSALGVQLAFQAIMAMQSATHHKIHEKKIFMMVLPWSALFAFILLFQNIIRHC